MGMWEYVAAPGYLLVLLLLQSISRKGSKVRSGCRSQELSFSSCLSLPCLVLIQKGISFNQPLHILRKLSDTKHKRQNNAGKELRMTPSFICYSRRFLQRKEK